MKAGHIQPRVQVRIISDLIDVGMTVQKAITVPRYIHIKAAKVGLELECASAVK